MRLRIILMVFVISALAVACDKKGDGGEEGGGGSAAAPAKPANGSPVAAEFVKFSDGKRGRAMEVRLYNFGPKTAAGYVLLARYMDKDGKLLKVKPGTPFEKGHDFTSLSGGKYQAPPEKWTTVTVDMFEIPEAATKAEVLVSKVDAAEGGKIAAWWSQKSWSEWPGDGDEAAGGDGDEAGGDGDEAGGDGDEAGGDGDEAADKSGDEAADKGGDEAAGKGGDEAADKGGDEAADKGGDEGGW